MGGKKKNLSHRYPLRTRKEIATASSSVNSQDGNLVLQPKQLELPNRTMSKRKNTGKKLAVAVSAVTVNTKLKTRRKVTKKRRSLFVPRRRKPRITGRDLKADDEPATVVGDNLRGRVLSPKKRKGTLSRNKKSNSNAILKVEIERLGSEDGDPSSNLRSCKKAADNVSVVPDQATKVITPESDIEFDVDIAEDVDSDGNNSSSSSVVSSESENEKFFNSYFRPPPPTVTKIFYANWERKMEGTK